MTETPEIRWLTIPDLTELLGLKVSQVRRLIEDRALLASRVDGVWKVPETFIVDGEPMSELRGTLVVLGDSGFTDEEAMHWLLSTDDSLGVSPVDALRQGRKAEVRRVAQALGF
ncbi:MAG: Rv2175c family DNA-binding protein [Rhodoglobus sp.]